MTPAFLLAKLRQLGATIRIVGDRLRVNYRHPSGSHDDFLDLLAEVKRQKPVLLALLRAERETPIRPEDIPGIVSRLTGFAADMASLARQDEILGASRRFAEAEADRARAQAARKGLAPGKWHTFDCHECGKDGHSPLVVSGEATAVCPQCGSAMVRNGRDAA